MNTLVVVVLIVGSVQGAEWMTSGSNHCIERCRPGTRKELDGVLWCPVVDGASTKHRAATESGRPSTEVTEEDKYKWDYCTPATVESLDGGDGYQEAVEAVVLPERVNRTRRQTGEGNVRLLRSGV